MKHSLIYISLALFASNVLGATICLDSGHGITRPDKSGPSFSYNDEDDNMWYVVAIGCFDDRIGENGQYIKIVYWLDSHPFNGDPQTTPNDSTLWKDSHPVADAIHQSWRRVYVDGVIRGLMEYQVAYDFASATKKYLGENGHKVKWLKEKNREVDLSNRSRQFYAFSNDFTKPEENAELYVSIHTNSAGSSATGTMFLYHTRSSFNVEYYKKYDSKTKTFSNKLPEQNGVPIATNCRTYMKVTADPPIKVTDGSYPRAHKLMYNIKQSGSDPRNNIWWDKNTGWIEGIHTFELGGQGLTDVFKGIYNIDLNREGDAEIRFRGHHQCDDDSLIAQQMRSFWNGTSNVLPATYFNATTDRGYWQLFTRDPENPDPNIGYKHSWELLDLSNLQYNIDKKLPQEIPGVLIETCFLSNPSTSAWVYNDGDNTHCDLVGQQIANSILNVLSFPNTLAHTHPDTLPLSGGKFNVIKDALKANITSVNNSANISVIKKSDNQYLITYFDDVKAPTINEDYLLNFNVQISESLFYEQVDPNQLTGTILDINNNSVANFEIQKDDAKGVGNFILTTLRKLAPGLYKFIISASGDDYTTGKSEITITVEESTNPITPRFHAYIKYQDPYGAVRPLPAGTEVLIIQEHRYPVQAPEYPHVLIGYKLIEEWVGTGYVAANDGYVNAELFQPWAGSPKKFRIVANCFSWDRESGGIKAFGKYYYGSQDYYKSLSWIFTADTIPQANFPNTNNVWRPTGGSVILLKDIEYDPAGGSVSLPFESSIPGVANDVVDPYGFPPVHQRNFRNNNGCFTQLSSAVKSYDFAKSTLQLAAGGAKSITSIIPGIKFLWKASRVDLSGGQTHLDPASNTLYIKGENNGDIDDRDDGIICRAYGEFFLKKLTGGGLVNMTDPYSWGVRVGGTKGTADNPTQQAFQKGFATWFSCAARRDPTMVNFDVNGDTIYSINIATGAYTNYQPKLTEKTGMVFPDLSLTLPSRGGKGGVKGVIGAKVDDLKGLDNEAAVAMQLGKIFNFYGDQWSDSASKATGLNTPLDPPLLVGKGGEESPELPVCDFSQSAGVKRCLADGISQNQISEKELIEEAKANANKIAAKAAGPSAPSMPALIAYGIINPDPSKLEHAGFTAHDIWNSLAEYSETKGDAVLTDYQKEGIREQYIDQGLKPALDSVGNTGGLRPLFSWISNGILAQAPSFKLEVSQYEDFSSPTTWAVGSKECLDLSAITDSAALVLSLSNRLLPGRYYWRVGVDKNDVLPNLYSPSGAFELYPDGTIVGADGGTVALGATPVYEEYKSGGLTTSPQPSPMRGGSKGGVIGGELYIPAGLIDDTTEVMFFTQAVSTPDEVGGYNVIGRTLWDISTDRSITVAAIQELPLQLRLTYDDSLLAGAAENALGIYRWDAAQTVWDYAGGTVNPDSNYITSSISGTGVYGILVDRRPPFISQVADRPDPITPLESSSQTSTISYKISEPARITLTVVDPSQPSPEGRGLVIRTLLNSYPQHSLTNTVTWDGRDSIGNLVASGRYQYVINATDFAGQEAVPAGGTILVTTGAVAGVEGNIDLTPNPFPGREGASVSIEGTTLCDTTDSAGSYSLTGLPAGDYNVLFSYPAYFEESRSVDLAEGQILGMSQVSMTNRALSGAAILLSRVTPNNDAIDEEQTASFTSDRKTVIKTEVLDLRGGGADSGWVVNTLVNDTLQPGYHVFRWDCRDQYLRLVPNGAYRIKISALASGVWVTQDTLDFVADVGLAQDLAVFPASFSPNGDEKDDQCEFRFLLTNQALLDLTILRMGDGKLEPVRRLLTRGKRYPGNNYVSWDGRDSLGITVPDGMYYYNLSPYFPTGQKSFELSGQIAVDASAPEIISLIPVTGDTLFLCNKPTLQAVIKAREGDLALREEMSLKLDGYDVPAVIKRENDSLYTVTFTPLTSIGNGTHIVIAYAKDNTGNEAPPLANAFEVAVTIPDITNPVIAKLTPADSSIAYNATPSVTAVLFDSLSGIDPETIELVVDGSQIVNQVQTLSIKHPYPEGFVDEGGKDYWTEQWLFTKNYLLYNPHTGYLRYNPSWPYANNTEHYVELRVRDKLGNAAVLARTTFHVIIDSIAPNIALQLPAENSASYQRIPKVSAYLADSGGAGVDFHSARVLVDGSELEVPGYSYDATSGKMEFTPQDLLPLDWGQHIVTLDVKDKAGNQAVQAYNLFNVLIDTLAPVLADVRPLDGSVFGNGLPYISFFGYDDGPLTGLSFKAYLDPSTSLGAGPDTAAPDSLTITPDTIATYYGLRAGFSCRLPLSGPLEAGVHLLKIVAADSAGHITTLMRNFTVYHDSLAPQITAISPADEAIVKIASPALEAQIREQGSGIGLAQILLDGKVVKELRDLRPDTTYTVSYTPDTPLLNSSEHQLTVKASDLAGLSSFKNSVFTVFLDSLAPEIYSVWPQNNSVTGDLMPGITVKLCENSGGSGIDQASAHLLLDGSEAGCTIAESSGMTVVSCLPLTSLGDGLHNVEFTVADKAGNRLEYVWQFTIYSGLADSAGPQVELVSPGPAAYINPARPGYSFILNLKDSVSGVLEDSIFVSLNGQNLVCSYQPASGQLSAGPATLEAGTSNVINVAVCDRAFNQTLSMYNFDCRTDTTGPGLESFAGSMVYGHYPVIQALASDQGSGILASSLTASIDGTPAALTYQDAGGVYHLTVQPENSLSAGSHSLDLHGSDQAGNNGSGKYEFQSCIDSLAPLIRDVQPSQYTLFSQRPLFSCSITDLGGTLNYPAAGVKNAALVLDGTPQTCLYDSSLARYCFQPAETLQSGKQHLFYFQATDVAGNEAFTSKYVFNIRIDTTAPVLSQNIPQGDCYNARPVIQAAVADEDNGSGPDASGLTMKLDGTVITPSIDTLAWGSLKASYQPADSLSQGSHSVEIEARDGSGNSASLSWSFPVIYGLEDTVAPLADIGWPVDVGIAYVGGNRQLEISGNAYDSLSGLDNSGIIFTLDGKALDGQLSYDWVNGGYRLKAMLDSQLLATTPQQSIISLKATDRSGNTGAASRVFTIETDSTPPYLAEFWPSAGLVVSDPSPAVWIKARDPQSGIRFDSVRIKVDGIPLIAADQPSGPYVKFTAQPDWQLAPNVLHTAEFTITDKAGNTSAARTDFMVSQDLIPPVVRDVIPNDGSVCYQKNPVISAGLLDVGSGIDPDSITLLLDGQGISCAGGFDPSSGLLTVAAGNDQADSSQHVLTIAVKDYAGNSTVYSGSFTVLIDTSAPAIDSIVPRDGDTVYTGIPLISAGISENLCLSEARLYLDDSEAAPGNLMIAARSAWLNYRPSGALAFGWHNIVVSATDKAGYQSCDTSRVFIAMSGLDTIKPELALLSPLNQKYLRQDADSFDIAAYAADTGSGIRAEDISLTLDGAVIPFSYQPYSGAISAKALAQTGGLHVLALEAGDRSGNKAAGATAGFNLLLDQELPQCRMITLDKDVIQQEYFEFRAVLLDSLSGIDTGRVAVSLDGVPAERTLSLNYLGQWEVSAVNSAPFSDGTTHHVSITAGDKAGNTSEPWEKQFMVMFDAVPPVLYGLTPSDSATVYSPVPSIACRLADQGSGIDTSAIGVYLDNARFTGYSYLPDSGLLTFSWPESLAAESQHSIFIKAADRAGNQTSVDGIFTVRLDAEAPVLLNLSLLEGKTLADPRPVISAEVRDNSGCINLPSSSVGIKIDGQAVPAVFQPENGCLSYQPLNGLSTGSHIITFYAGDRAGNTTVRDVSVVLAPGSDAKPPFISEARPSDGGTYYAGSSGLNIRAVLGDEETGVDSCRIEALLDGKPAVLQGYNRYTGQGLWKAEASVNTQHRMDVIAYDLAGNKTGYQAVFSLLPDNEAPVIGKLNVAGYDRVVLSVKPDDQASGIDRENIACTIDGVQVAHAYENGTVSFSPLNAWKQGSRHLVSLKVGDLAGNIREQDLDLLYNDLLKPVLLASYPSPKDTVYSTKGFTVEYRLQDKGSGIGSAQIWLDQNLLSASLAVQENDTWTARASVTGAPGEGLHDLRLLTADGAGNQMERISQFLYLPDSIAPAISQIWPQGSDTVYAGKLKVTARISDERSGVETGSLTVAVDDKPYVAGLSYSGSYWLMQAVSGDGHTLPDGSHTISITAWDRAGNQAYPVTVSLVSQLDCMPPVISQVTPGLSGYVDPIPVITASLFDGQSGLDTAGIFLKVGDSNISVKLVKNGDNTYSLTGKPDKPLAAGTYQYTIDASDKAGLNAVYGGSLTVSDRLELANVRLYPNPFGSKLKIDYVLTQKAKEAKVKIYAVTGQLLKEISGSTKAGFNAISWDGRNNSGQSVSSGVYFYRLEVSPESGGQPPVSKLGKIVRLK